jgi:hypothetical protein
MGEGSGEWQSLIDRAERDSPYERRFVERVLTKVKGLDPRSVSPQYHFKDSDGRPRRVDFAIMEGDYVRVAIEVDGWDKTGRGAGMNPREFHDWSRRETSLEAQGWRVLRFANSRVNHDFQTCIGDISSVLTQERSVAAKLAEAHIARQELADAKRRLRHSEVDRGSLERIERNQRDHRDTLQNEFRRFITEQRRSNRRLIWGLTAVAVIVLTAVGAWLFVPGLRSEQTPAAQSACPGSVDWREAADHVGETVVVEGPVVSGTFDAEGRGRLTFLNVGNPYPNGDRFVVVIPGSDRSDFAPAIETSLIGSTVCARGTIELREGVPQMFVRAPSQLNTPEA